MASYLSLEEAAAKLGIPTQRLVDLRSQGQVRGFRDGASWKFPDNEIARVADELGDDLAGGSGIGSGSGLLVNESSPSSGGSNIIGGDDKSNTGGGSDLGVGGETLQPGSDSDVNLVTSDGDGSDVAVVASGADSNDITDPSLDDEELIEIDSADLELEGPAIMHDSAQLDLAIEPTTGSTGPITDEELSQLSDSDSNGISSTGKGAVDDDDSGEDVLALPGDDDDLDFGAGGASSLELMSDLDASESDSAVASRSSAADVLSELDLLSAEQEGSGLVKGDSDNLLSSSGVVGGSAVENDDALDDDDDLMISDDDDDLVISSAGSDVSIAGDSGINLMSPSDSGLSLESEPLDLAGSSISALDLGAELGSGSGTGGSGGSGGKSGPRDKSGSAIDFQDDEEFQLSPSGIGLDDDSGSQVIEVEDSEAIAQPVEFGEGAFDDDGGDVFAADDGAAGLDEDDQIAIDSGADPVAALSPRYAGYEIPFTMFQVVGLMLIICVLGVGGMLMTDLVRNIWTYSEPSAPVSSLTNWLIQLMGWN